MMSMGFGPSSGSEPPIHKLLYFTNKESNADGSHIEPEQSKQDKPKDQCYRLVKINLATQKGKSQPVLMSANLPIKIRQALLTLLQEFEDAFTWTYA